MNRVTTSKPYTQSSTYILSTGVSISIDIKMQDYLLDGIPIRTRILERIFTSDDLSEKELMKIENWGESLTFPKNIPTILKNRKPFGGNNPLSHRGIDTNKKE
jgi:hypothetical protein